MSETAPRGVGNGEILAIAGAAAGAVAGIAVAIMRPRRRSSDPRQQLASLVGHLRAEESVQRGQSAVAEAISQARASLEAGVPVVAGEALRLGALSREEAKRVGGALGERLQTTGSLLGRELRKGSDVADRASSVIDDLTKRSRGGAKRLRKQSESYAEVGLDRARDAGETVTEAVREWVPELRERVEKQVIPLLHDLGDQTSERAHDLYDVARDGASDARRAAEKDVAPAVAGFTAQARDVIGETSHRLAEEAEDLGERVSDVSEVALERASELGRKAQAGTKQAADASVQGGKDFGSLLLWFGIGGALIYYVFLNERQREQVQRIAQTVFTEGREVYRDIQGRDDEFA